MPLEATLLKTKSGTDRFITEKYADQIATILAEWSAGLRKSSPDLQAIEKTLTPDFSGFSPQTADSRLVRSGPTLEVHQKKFPTAASLGQDAFIKELRSDLSPFSTIVTAEFQIVSIDAEPMQNPTHLRTRVRYELVGPGRGFHREQRVGEWEMEWESPKNPSDDSAKDGGYRLRAWRALSETRSRAAEPIFADIATQVFAGVPSYSAQLAHGVDYWRTTFDVASGIDIYGHNGVSVGDIDGDGFDDLYVCQPAGLPNRLYRNRGDGTFEDITETSGVGVLENTACALFADIRQRRPSGPDRRAHQRASVVSQSG